MIEFHKTLIGPVDDIYAARPFVKGRDWAICHFGGGQTSQTTTSDSAPWTGQQPFLTGLFNSAQNQYSGYNPNYFGFNGTPGSTPTQTGQSEVAPFNPQETGAIAQLGNLGMNGTPGMTTAANTVSNIASSDPNANPGNTAFNSLTNGAQVNANNPANGTLNNFMSGASANNNPALSTLGTNANLNPNGNPGNSALANYANGSMLSSGNPYFSSMADQIKAQVLPGLMSSFTQGTTDNPNVAYGVTNGLANAIGGLAEQNYNTQSTNQINAGNIIGQNYNTGVSNSTNAATNLGNQYNTGASNQLTAANTSGQNYFSSLADQLQAGAGVSSNYNTGVTNNLNAASTEPYLYNTQLGGANAALTGGQAQQTQSQNELTNNVNAYNFYQNLPYSQINQLANLITGQYGMTGTSTTSQPNQSFFGSLFSDRRLKENIRPIGKAENGLTIYAYNYKGSGFTLLGFMADEVKKVHPGAVTNDPVTGYAMVDYNKAITPIKEVA